MAEASCRASRASPYFESKLICYRSVPFSTVEYSKVHYILSYFSPDYFTLRIISKFSTAGKRDSIYSWAIAVFCICKFIRFIDRNIHFVLVHLLPFIIFPDLT